MASLKFYLDKRSRKTDGTYPLKITVSHKKPFHISLNVSIPAENWIDNKIEGNIKNKKFLNDYIKARYAGIENLILKMHLHGTLENTSPDELKKQILALVAPDDYPEETKEKIKGENYLFRTHAEKFIATRDGRGTKEVYEYTMEMLNKRFDLNTLTFGMINYEWVEQLDADLRTTIKVNTVSIHLRNIRAIFKNATKKKLVSRDLYPFEDYTIRNEETPHRIITVEDIQTLRDYEVEPHQVQYRDLFLLQFYLIGVNAIDILTATTDSIHKGRFEYRRAKTGKLYSVKIEPEAAEIIRKYPGKKQLLSFLDNYTDHKDFVHRYNNNLKEIGPWEWKPAKSTNGRGIVKKIRKPLFPFLSSYYSRHSWATIASGLDISKDVISAALGHGKKTVTDIYIKFDMRKVDAANRRIIDLINGKK